MIVPMGHVDLVRRAYEAFNRKDFDRVLDDFDPGVELWDTLRQGAVVTGKDAVRTLWQERFGQASAHFAIDELLEVDDAVLASVRIQSYTEHGASFGHEFSAVYRFTFHDDRVVRLESRTVDEVPDSIRNLFGES